MKTLKIFMLVFIIASTSWGQLLKQNQVKDLPDSILKKLDKTSFNSWYDVRLALKTTDDLTESATKKFISPTWKEEVDSGLAHMVDLTGVPDSSMYVVENGVLVPKTPAEMLGILGISSSTPPKIYRALLTQIDTSQTVTILENTLGNIIWTRNSTVDGGDFFGTLSGIFLEQKTFIRAFINSYDGSGNGWVLESKRLDNNKIHIGTYSQGEGMYLPSTLVISFEIIVYP